MAYLENENIVLRALEPEDLDDLYRWENDSELWKYGLTIAPYSKFALRDYLLGATNGLIHNRQLRLVTVDKKTGASIGTIDLYDYDPINLRAGIGILLDAAYRNKGFGKEILGLVKEYAFHVLHLKQLYACIPENNASSFKLFAACGYEQCGLLKAWRKTSDGFDNVHIVQLLGTR
ncbi:MAG: GNAT family N-acetyltransferase [Dysgonamonadaceae bacterium]|jgi:diamine N-acetyltransferase|nr:GNAT family N-acetyltransferase [Dysgonamonadaceae bacterium]